MIRLIKKKKKTGSQFSRKQLKVRDDWQEWHNSELLQLDNYEVQNMFGEPQPSPSKAKVLNLL